MRHIYFIDSENVNDSWLFLLEMADERDELLVFYTPKSPHMSYMGLRRLKESKKDVTFIECYEGANALDFQLVGEVGFRIHDVTDEELIIVSNDTGYDAVVRYWRDRKYPVRRFNSQYVKNLYKSVMGKKNGKDTDQDARKEESKQKELPALKKEERPAVIEKRDQKSRRSQGEKQEPAESREQEMESPVTAEAVSQEDVPEETVEKQIPEIIEAALPNEEKLVPSEVSGDSEQQTVETSEPEIVEESENQTAAPIEREQQPEFVPETVEDVPVVSAEQQTADEMPVQESEPASQADDEKQAVPESVAVIPEESRPKSDDKPSAKKSSRKKSSGKKSSDKQDSDKKTPDKQSADKKASDKKDSGKKSRQKKSDSKQPETPEESAPQVKTEETPAVSEIDLSEIEDIVSCLGKDNLSVIHTSLQLLFPDDSDKLYRETKARLSEIKGKNRSREEKFKNYVHIIFRHSGFEGEIPTDFVSFLFNNPEKRKNLNSLRSAINSAFGKERGAKYYSVVKPHVKTLNTI